MSIFPTLPRRHRAPVLTVLLMITTVLLGTAVPAHAGENERISVAGGEAFFTAEDEIIWATNGRKDGYCIKAELGWYEWNGWEFEWITAQAVQCGANDYSYNDINLPEGQEVKLRVCYSHGEYDVVRCSGWQKAVA